MGSLNEDLIAFVGVWSWDWLNTAATRRRIIREGEKEIRQTHWSEKSFASSSRLFPNDFLWYKSNFIDETVGEVGHTGWGLSSSTLSSTWIVYKAVYSQGDASHIHRSTADSVSTNFNNFTMPGNILMLNCSTQARLESGWMSLTWSGRLKDHPSDLVMPQSHPKA